MKSLLIVAAVLTFSFSSAVAQTTGFAQAEHDGWLVEIEKAYEISESTGKPIMANFTGSDWCGWCKRLSAEVFKKKEFQSWAEENVVLLELDYPRRKQLSEQQKSQNYELQKAFQVTGFPTIWIFDLTKDQATSRFEIKAIGKMGYMAGGAKAFTGQANQMIAQAKGSIN
ncbi:thioredoxin family protein [Reichenbachiella versicolor]|uniref:thioredoxin family protein n=1 Tax=Reichenbachiella versicolor TaxID=1821036 RepID=UPI0013A580F7|nr:thioredoxin family protein [Reichenbachiella versicolor]